MTSYISKRLRLSNLNKRIKDERHIRYYNKSSLTVSKWGLPKLERLILGYGSCT